MDWLPSFRAGFDPQLDFFFEGLGFNPVIVMVFVSDGKGGSGRV